MTHEDHPERLSDADQALVDRIAELSEPTPMTPSQRVAFTDALDARIVARRRRRGAFSAAAAVVVTAALVALAVPRFSSLPGSDPTPTAPGRSLAQSPTPALEPAPVADPVPEALSEPQLAEASDAASDTWEEELIFASDLDSLIDTSSGADTDELPEDYAAIASLFLDV